MKKLFLALALCVAPTFAWAQCNGVFSANQVCGSVGGGPPAPTAFGSFTGGGSTTLIVGTTTITSGTDKGLLYDNAGILGNLATTNGGVLNTSATGVPSITTGPTIGVASTTNGFITLANSSNNFTSLIGPGIPSANVSFTLPPTSGLAGQPLLSNAGASAMNWGTLGLKYGGTNVDLTATGGTSQVLKQTSVGGNIAVARLACADLSDSTSACSTSIGTSGATIPLLSTANTWTLGQTFSAALTYGGVTLSNAVTGTGNMVLSASPTLSGTVGGTLTFSGPLTLSSALTYGGVALTNAVTGTGKMVLDTNPQLGNNVGLGIAANAKNGLLMSPSITGGTDSAGLQISPTFSAVNNGGNSYGMTVVLNFPASAAYTVDTVEVGRFEATVAGAGATITNAYSLVVDAQTVGATKNRSLYVTGGTSEFLGPVLFNSTGASVTFGTGAASSTAYVNVNGGASGNGSGAAILLQANASLQSAFGAHSSITGGAYNGNALFYSVANALEFAPGGSVQGTWNTSGGLGIGTAIDPGAGNLTVSGVYKVGSTAGLSATVTVRASGGAADCTLVFTGGIKTGGSC